MPTSWISDEMRALVGREHGTAQRSVPIALSDIRRWALAIHWPEVPPRLYWDEAHAATTRHGGIVAPEDFNPFAWFTADGPVVPPAYDGTGRTETLEERLGATPPATRFMMNGGNDVTYGVRMRPGDEITFGTTRLVDYEERESRLGLLLTTITEWSWTNQAGELVKTMRHRLLRY